MTRSLIIVALFALAACDTAGTMQTASAPRGSAEARFVTAMQNNGCIMNQANAGRVREQSGLSDDEIKAVVTGLAVAGKIEESMGASLKLTSGACAA